VLSEQRTQDAGVVLAVPTTTNTNTPTSNYHVLIEAQDIQQVPSDHGTVRRSVACCEHLRALSVDRFAERLGRLGSLKAAMIEEAIMRALALPPE